MRRLPQSPPATAPSRREPLFVRVFSLCRRRIFCLFLGAFKPIPQALRASRPYRKGAMSLCNFWLSAAKKAEAKVKVSKPKTAEKRKSRTLLQSPPATAPSRREPLFLRVFSLCRRKARTKNQALKTESPHISFCGSAVGHYEPFWEEGVTRKRDERSPRDQSAAKGHTVAGFCVFGSFSSMFCIH